MAGFKVLAPSNLNQLEESLQTLYKNSSHVKAIDIDERSSSVQIVLDGKAHFFGYQDMQIPLLSNKLDDARLTVARVLKSIRDGHPPTHVDAQELYDFVQH